MASLCVTIRLPAAPEVIYRHWLSSRGHTSMTGGKAKASTRKGGRFTTWDGHIRGKNLTLKPRSRIIQSWRTSEFPKGAKDSRIELFIHAAGKSGSKLVFTHSRLTLRQVKQYRRGWTAHYWKPMKKYFAARKKTARY